LHLAGRWKRFLARKPEIYVPYGRREQGGGSMFILGPFVKVKAAWPSAMTA
jgi:hypothetical protein